MTWTVLRQEARQLSVKTLKVEVHAGTYQAESAPGTAIFDNFKLETNVYGWQCDNIYQGGSIMVMEETSSTSYLVSDSQGSKRLVMNSSGGVVARHDYYPYGEAIQAGVGLRTSGQGFGATDRFRSRFAGTEGDGGTGLEHTLWRKMESRSGRWTSVDPYRGSMRRSNPQTFNRYSYVQNDSVNRVDPTGLYDVCTTSPGGTITCYNAGGPPGVRLDGGPIMPPFATSYSGLTFNSLFNVRNYPSYPSGYSSTTTGLYEAREWSYSSMIGGGGGYTVGPAPQDSAPQQPVPQPAPTPTPTPEPPSPGLGSNQCDSYLRGPVTRPVLFYICTQFGNTATERCVRQCLQSNFDPNIGLYTRERFGVERQFGVPPGFVGIETHAYCIAKCLAGG